MASVLNGVAGLMNRYETVTFVYNEEFLLPFYLKHYSFADRLNIIYDVDSNDRTLEILQNAQKVNIIHFKFPDMMDDDLKVQQVNEIYKGLFDTWALIVDADEFVFVDKDPIEQINSVAFSHVFRHVTEGDLDINKSIKEQRRHGYLDAFYYVKPILVRSGLNLQWGTGNHNLVGVSRPPAAYEGAHWANADPCFCIQRQIKDRKERQSRNNLNKKLTFQYHHITEGEILKRLKDHENDPLCW